jgi:hypothetical protein
MQAAGPQGPLPATDAVIEGLPRVELDEDAIGELTSPRLLADRQKRVHLRIAPYARTILYPEMRSCEFHASKLHHFLARGDAKEQAHLPCRLSPAMVKDQWIVSCLVSLPQSASGAILKPQPILTSPRRKQSNKTKSAPNPS